MHGTHIKACLGVLGSGRGQGCSRMSHSFGCVKAITMTRASSWLAVAP
jgi:hypothetical protein